jgi:hypothetical protein
MSLDESRARRKLVLRWRRRKRLAAVSLLALAGVGLGVAFWGGWRSEPSAAVVDVAAPHEASAASEAPAPRTSVTVAAVGDVTMRADFRRRAARITPTGAILPPGRARPALRAPGRAGELTIVPGRSRVSGSGPVRRFLVEVEGGLRIAPRAFARRVQATLFDRRSWARSGGFALQRVDSGPIDFRVALASPRLTDRLCLPLQTNGIFSCAAGSRAVLNSLRWTRGADAYARLGPYRTYMVNHEVGHTFGHGHVGCPAGGEPAPVMMQQTKGVAPCGPNPWPLPSERG